MMVQFLIFATIIFATCFGQLLPLELVHGYKGDVGTVEMQINGEPAYLVHTDAVLTVTAELALLLGRQNLSNEAVMMRAKQEGPNVPLTFQTLFRLPLDRDRPMTSSPMTTNYVGFHRNMLLLHGFWQSPFAYVLAEIRLSYILCPDYSNLCQNFDCTEEELAGADAFKPRFCLFYIPDYTTQGSLIRDHYGSMNDHKSSASCSRLGERMPEGTKHSYICRYADAGFVPRKIPRAYGFIRLPYYSCGQQDNGTYKSYDSLCDAYTFKTPTFCLTNNQNSCYVSSQLMVFFTEPNLQTLIPVNSYVLRMQQIGIKCLTGPNIRIVQQSLIEKGTHSRLSFECNRTIKLDKSQNPYTVSKLTVEARESSGQHVLSFIYLVNMPEYNESAMTLEQIGENLLCRVPRVTSNNQGEMYRGAFRTRIEMFLDNGNSVGLLTAANDIQIRIDASAHGTYICKAQVRFRTCAPRTDIFQTMEKNITLPITQAPQTTNATLLAKDERSDMSQFSIIIAAVLILMFISFLIVIFLIKWRARKGKKVATLVSQKQLVMQPKKDSIVGSFRAKSQYSSVAIKTKPSSVGKGTMLGQLKRKSIAKDTKVCPVHTSVRKLVEAKKDSLRQGSIEKVIVKVKAVPVPPVKAKGAEVTSVTVVKAKEQPKATPGVGATGKINAKKEVAKKKVKQ